VEELKDSTTQETACHNGEVVLIGDMPGIPTNGKNRGTNRDPYELGGHMEYRIVVQANPSQDRCSTCYQRG
jgi:hypothetical protein